jgi:hypothetical protein
LSSAWSKDSLYFDRSKRGLVKRLFHFIFSCSVVGQLWVIHGVKTTDNQSISAILRSQLFSWLHGYFELSLQRIPREESPSVAPASLGKHLAIGLETLQMFTP